jgi:hypothetical protein
LFVLSVFFFQNSSEIYFSREGERVMVSNLALADGQEGISAFLEKRKAKWT